MAKKVFIMLFVLFSLLYGFFFFLDTKAHYDYSCLCCNFPVNYLQDYLNHFVSKANYPMISFLQIIGADLDATEYTKSYLNKTTYPLEIAVADIEMANFLIRNGVKIDICTRHQSAFDNLLFNGKIKVAQYLIEIQEDKRCLPNLLSETMKRKNISQEIVSMLQNELSLLSNQE